MRVINVLGLYADFQSPWNVSAASSRIILGPTHTKGQPPNLVISVICSHVNNARIDIG